MGGPLIALGLLLLAVAVRPAPRQEDAAQVRGTPSDEELVRAVAEAPPGALRPVLLQAYERMVWHAERGDYPSALPLAEALFAREPAPWSADSLSLTLSRLGVHGRARDVLGPWLDAASPAADREALLERRALASLAAGERQAALDDLGAALAAGSADAASIFGMLALRESRMDPARALFRAVLLSVPDGDPRQAWARRGWGLTMLP